MVPRHNGYDEAPAPGEGTFLPLAESFPNFVSERERESERRGS